MTPCPGQSPWGSEEIDYVAGVEDQRDQAARMADDRDRGMASACSPARKDVDGSSSHDASPAPVRASTSCCCDVGAPGWDSYASCPARLARATGIEGPWTGRPDYGHGHGLALDRGSCHVVRRANSLGPERGPRVAVRARWTGFSRASGLEAPGRICHDLCGLRRRGSSQHLELARKLAADGCGGVVAMAVLGAAGMRDQVESQGLHRRRPCWRALRAAAAARSRDF
jgi:hypothetical protein